MTRLVLLAALATLPFLPGAALAAPGCSVGPITGLLGPNGATVTLQASPGKPCGARLWVQSGVIPFTALRATRAPQHGHLTVSDPTQFTYTPDADYKGPDVFEIIARGNDRGGSQVTGTLKVNATVTGR